MPRTPGLDARRRIQPPVRRADAAAAAAPRGGRIKVVVRKRPMRTTEVGDVVRCADGGREVAVDEEKKRLDLSLYTETHRFTFDEAFGESDSTEEVYRRSAAALLDTFVGGGNASCFAYGQTGSGKTHTMLGGPAGADGSPGEEGLYILACRDLFRLLTDVDPHGRLQVHASLFEIYCEKLYDLVAGRTQVHAREGGDGVVKICGLTEHVVSTEQEILNLVAASNQYRSSGATAANSRSSRSHAVLRLTLREAGADQELCQMTFVDLAGSERGADTADRDQKTRREGSEINKSLLALKECIRGLDLGHKHVKFRGSKLTEVLKASFTGNCRTCMIATVSPSGKDVEHSMNTLRYAHRVKSLPPVKVSSAAQRRMTPPSNLPNVARRAHGLPPAEQPETTDSQGLPRPGSRRAWQRRARRSNMPRGPCVYCNSTAHHSLLCRKPRRYRPGPRRPPAVGAAAHAAQERHTDPHARQHPVQLTPPHLPPLHLPPLPGSAPAARLPIRRRSSNTHLDLSLSTSLGGSLG